MKCPSIKIYKCSDGFVTDNEQVAKSHEANIKSNKLVCPFCNLDIRTHRIFTDGCDNTHSPLWQELIRTRKALDLAKEGLKEIQDKGEYVNPIELAESYLDEITALEQKDVK